MDAAKNFNRFDEVTHTPLRVYNRVVLMHNLLEDFGTSVVADYIATFTEDERKQMFLFNAFLKKEGKEAAHKLASKDLKTDYNPEDDIDERT